jgi:hypothetical protein
MKRACPLPLSPEFSDPEVYIESLLRFATSSELFQRLCGGVHILDFFTREPDLYSSILPQEWRDWFQLHDVQDILDLFMREDLGQLRQPLILANEKQPSPPSSSSSSNYLNDSHTWRGHRVPPVSLLDYIQTIRKHTLDRTFKPAHDDLPRQGSGRDTTTLTRRVAVGMKAKKMHEVENFAKYIDSLNSDITHDTSHRISQLVDFGSGQNYLGRALASPPYEKNVIAIESKSHNIDGAKHMDVTAQLAKKKIVMRNKKEFRKAENDLSNTPLSKQVDDYRTNSSQSPAIIQMQDGSHGNMQYIELLIQDGDLSPIANHIPDDAQLMIVSLHSCGNLLHHGVRSLILNPVVKAIAMVGCCYNLVTERLGPPTYKLSNMRSSSLRLDQTSSACDPHGFPMSERLAQYRHHSDKGMRFNITARMMAVQAPYNWTPADCESFFTRHFYRALLQRIFLDRGIVGKPTPTPTPTDNHDEVPTPGTTSPRDWTGASAPILIGTLPKHAYATFTTYVRGALAKLNTTTTTHNNNNTFITNRASTLTDEEIENYEKTHQGRKKNLSIIWSLMAFSAGVVESIIVVDRWLFLREQWEVGECWVEAVFEYGRSPRNLVVVGVKKSKAVALRG